jgi:hypothetical protein
MDRPNDRDYRNLEERNAAYWREQADKLAEALQEIASDGKYSGGNWCALVAAEALAEYNASK